MCLLVFIHSKKSFPLQLLGKNSNNQEREKVLKNMFKWFT